jgi:hypothetical protein
MLKPGFGMWLDRDILNRELLPSRPPHNGFRDLDVLLIRKCNGERERFPLSHGQVS